jgi:hypothetical protein
MGDNRIYIWSKKEQKQQVNRDTRRQSSKWWDKRKISIMNSPSSEQDELYLRIGEFVVSFGKVEYSLEHLLGVLTDEEGNMWIKPFFIDDLMVGRVLGKIEQTAKFRLHDNQSLFNELKDTIKKIRTIQQKRNNIVHGDWVIDPTGRFTTKLRNYRLRFEDGCWQYIDDKVMTPTKLKNLSNKSKELVTDLDKITLKIQANKAEK